MDLRDEFQQLLGSSGRDRGMKGMKAPKGSLEWLKQQQNSKTTPKPQAAGVPTNTGAPGDAAPALTEKPSGPSLAGPPVTKPKTQAPAPTYQELDALLSGKTPAASTSTPSAPEVVAPPARPAYAVDSGSSVSLLTFDKGDAVPESAWAALTDGEGQSLSLANLASEGGELVLLVPESAHHTGGPSETWTKLLIDLQNMLGSHPAKVRAVAVSPEPKEVHAKMMTRYNLKLFHFASDTERAFLAAHKVWDPQAAQRGVSVERQTFIIDTATKKFAHVFASVPAVGHAEAVRDVLQQLQNRNTDAQDAPPPSLIAPPPKPVVAPEAPRAEPPAAPEETAAAAAAAAAEAAAAVAPVAGRDGGSPLLSGPPVPREAAQQDAQADSVKQLDEEEAFALEVESVGPLIGRGGARVKDLAASSGASIRFENEPAPTMYARGSPEQRAKAYEILAGWIENSGVETVAIPLDMHGRIIGAGGAKIKEIEMLTRAHVLFEREPEPCMVVRGNATERAAAIAMANAIIDSHEFEEERLQLSDVSDRTHVRAVLGYKGAFVRKLEVCGYVWLGAVWWGVLGGREGEVGKGVGGWSVRVRV